MKNFKQYLFMSVAALVGLATLAGLTGIVPDGGFLADLVNFFSLGSMGGASLAVIAVGAGSAEVTETTTSGANEYAAVDDIEGRQARLSPARTNRARRRRGFSGSAPPPGKRSTPKWKGACCGSGKNAPSDGK